MIDTGGPANPTSLFAEGEGVSWAPGVTWLDLAAMHALPHFIRVWTCSDEEFMDWPAVAADCYKAACALLAEKRRLESEK